MLGVLVLLLYHHIVYKTLFCCRQYSVFSRSMATNEDNLYSIFEVSARNFSTKNCIISAGNSICHSLTYTVVVHEVQRLSDTVAFPRHQFVGILGYEVSTEIILCILRYVLFGSYWRSAQMLAFYPCYLLPVLPAVRKRSLF